MVLFELALFDTKMELQEASRLKPAGTVRESLRMGEGRRMEKEPFEAHCKTIFREMCSTHQLVVDWFHCLKNVSYE